MDKADILAKYKAKQQLLGINNLDIELKTDQLGNKNLEVVRYNGKGGMDNRLEIPTFVDSIAEVNFNGAIIKIPKGKIRIAGCLAVHPNYKMMDLWGKINGVNKLSTTDIENDWEIEINGHELRNVNAIEVEDGSEVMELTNNPLLGGTLIINGRTGEVNRSIANEAILNYYVICRAYMVEHKHLTKMDVFTLNQRKNPDEYSILDELMSKTDIVKRHGQ